MTLQEIQRFRRLAETWKLSEFSELAVALATLCDEVERLQGIADERFGQYTDFTLMPFGKHKGKQLAQIPDDYFEWWLIGKNRNIIKLESEHSTYPKRSFAQQSLKLYDYVIERFNRGTG